MKNIEIINPTGIKSAVKKISILKEHTFHKEHEYLKFFADGYPGIMFYKAESDVLFNQEIRKPVGLIFFGQTIKPIELTLKGPYKIIIFHLFSHVTHAMFSISANEFTDNCVDYELLIETSPGSIIQKLQEMNSTKSQINLIFQSLQKQLEKIKSTNSCSLHWVIEQLYTTNGAASFDSILDRLNISQRTFERRFLQHVGVTPSFFKRIVQFNAALEHLKTGTFQKLTDVAFDNGFSDQSHFGRTFKQFTGLTAKEYLQNFNKYKENYSNLQEYLPRDNYKHAFGDLQFT